MKFIFFASAIFSLFLFSSDTVLAADYEALTVCTEKTHAAFNEKMQSGELKSSEAVDAVTKSYFKDLRECYVTTDSLDLMPLQLRTEEEKVVFKEQNPLSGCLDDAGQLYQTEVGGCTTIYMDDIFDQGMSQAAAEKKLLDCSQGAVLDKHAERVAACYGNTEFGNIFDLPVLKKSISESMLDIKELVRKPEANQRAAECVADLFAAKKHEGDIATFERDVADCFAKEGFLNTADLYEKTAIIIDCSNESLQSVGVANVGDAFDEQNKKAQSYIEKCVIKKTSGVIAALAAVNVPFASGIYNVALYAQFLFTQPLLLIARRRRKSWGQVFNAFTKQPVDLGLVRLYDHANKKLLRSMVTGRKGTYLFLVEPGDYKVEVEKSGFSFPSTAAQHEKHESYYFGEKILVDSEDDVIDKQVPVDPKGLFVSIRAFKWRKWKYRFTLFVGFIAPLFSMLSFIIIPKWWTGLLLVVHVILLVLFMRLGIKKHKRYGTVYDENKKPTSGVVVSLFAKQYNKLVEYHVSDIFGRYFFPAAEGEFTIRYDKKGYKQKEIDVQVTREDMERGSIGITMVMEKT